MRLLEGNLLGLVDCNNFYVSCERLFRPKLMGRPVVVLSNNDGCVVSRSEEAKALGIPMGVPLFQIRNLVRREGVVVCSSNYNLYSDISRRVMEVINEQVEAQEIYSIDECFISMPLGAEGVALGREVRKKVLKGVGIPTCVGLGPTKTIAKLANRVAKKNSQHGGVYSLEDTALQMELYAVTDVEDVWGIGRRSAKKMNKMGVFTVACFLSHSPAWVKHNFTKVGLDIYYELQGEQRIEFKKATPRKSITRSRSFGYPVSSMRDLYQILLEFAQLCCEELQAKRLAALRVSLFITTDPFNTDVTPYSRAVETTLTKPTAHLMELAPIIYRLLEEVYRQGFVYKKAGLHFSSLVPEGSFFQFEEGEAALSSEKMRGVEHLEKQINKKYGEGTLYSADRDPAVLNRIVKREKASQNYTTSLKDIIEITPH